MFGSNGLLGRATANFRANVQVEVKRDPANLKGKPVGVVQVL